MLYAIASEADHNREPTEKSNTGAKASYTYQRKGSRYL